MSRLETEGEASCHHTEHVTDERDHGALLGMHGVDSGERDEGRRAVCQL